jgi:hypothetical protein
MKRCAASARRALIADLVGTMPTPLAGTAPTSLVGTMPTPPAGTAPTHPACTEPAAIVRAGQILSSPQSVHRDLVAGSPDETLQLVATQCSHSQAPALLCPECTTTRDARAARNPNPESSR